MRTDRPILLLCLLLGLAGCDALPWGFTPVSDIVKDPAAFDRQEVRLRGRVTDVLSLALFEFRGYTLEDETGRIFVVQPETLPKMGEQIAIRGRVENLFILHAKGFGTAVVEIDRLPATAILGL